MEIQKIAILGAGALGAAYASMINDAGGFEVSFIARGDRYRRLHAQPLSINQKDYMIPVVNPDETAAPADLVIVALKHHHLDGALADLENVVGPDTVILSVMNGLDSEAIIGARYGLDKMVLAIAVGIDAVFENGRVTYANPGRILFGTTADAGVDADQLARLQRALDRAGIPNGHAAVIINKINAPQHCPFAGHKTVHLPAISPIDRFFHRGAGAHCQQAVAIKRMNRPQGITLGQRILPKPAGLTGGGAQEAHYQ